MSFSADQQRVAVIASLGRSLVNFRIELLKRMKAQGHEVFVLAPEFDQPTVETLEANGITRFAFPLARTGTNPFQDLRTRRALSTAIGRIAPDVLLPYTMKPIIYGNMAARHARVRGRFALFTGLGYTFSEERPTGKRALVRAISVVLYRRALKGLTGAFVYNSSEEEDLRRFQLVDQAVPIMRVPGSGVDLNRFSFSDTPSGPPRFLMISRLLRSKGVRVYAEALRQLRECGHAVDARLLGPYDTNPDACSPSEVEAWQRDGLLTYDGETDDVRPHIGRASVLVLPTLHREGLPRSVLEAMSMGRAIITSDVPGCRDSIVDGEHGFITRAGDAGSLAAAMQRFLDHPQLAASMGQAGRRRAETHYDVHRVNAFLLRKMGLEGQP